MPEIAELEKYVPWATDRNAISSAGDLPTTYARDNSPILQYGGVRLHSAVNPLAEATALIAAFESQIVAAATGGRVRIVILGPGLGYLIQAAQEFLACKCPNTVAELICVETEPAIARKALQLRVWEPTKLICRWTVVGAGLLELERSAAPTVVLRGTPGYRAAKDRYEAALGTSAPPSSTGTLRILVPTPMYGGSYPIARYCAAALSRLGHDVELFDLAEYHGPHRALESLTSSPTHRRALQGLHATLLSEMIAARAIEFRADLVWAVAQTPLVPATLAELKQAGVRTAFWFVEDFRLFDYWREIGPHYDAFFTIQRGQFVQALADAGIRNSAYLPLAADPRVHRPLNLDPEVRTRFGSRTSFVGAGYPNRRAAFSELRLPDFKIWGNDWPDHGPLATIVQEHGRRLESAECVNVFNATEVNLNLHSSMRSSSVDPAGDFVNPRTFELAACGAFQLVDRRTELAELFAEGTEQVVFDSIDELPGLVSYYLDHPAPRQVIAGAARERVLREHTYEHRLATALDLLSGWWPELKVRRRNPNYLASLLAAAAGDDELTAFLSTFDGERALTLDDIVGRIQDGSGTLSRPEAMFLLMKEFRDWGVERGVIA
ncbi:glycosyltransferase [candidate division KSB1 bacterium]|nr:glycosyltransferase [candidate division KSB1 bacterium]